MNDRLKIMLLTYLFYWFSWRHIPCLLQNGMFWHEITCKILYGLEHPRKDTTIIIIIIVDIK